MVTAYAASMTGTEAPEGRGRTPYLLPQPTPDCRPSMGMAASVISAPRSSISGQSNLNRKKKTVNLVKREQSTRSVHML